MIFHSMEKRREREQCRWTKKKKKHTLGPSVFTCELPPGDFRVLRVEITTHDTQIDSPKCSNIYGAYVLIYWWVSHTMPLKITILFFYEILFIFFARFFLVLFKFVSSEFVTLTFSRDFLCSMEWRWWWVVDRWARINLHAHTYCTSSHKW